MKRKEKANTSPDLAVTNKLKDGAEVKAGNAKKCKSIRGGVVAALAAKIPTAHEDAEKVPTGQENKDRPAAEARTKERKKRKASTDGGFSRETDLPAAEVGESAEKRLVELPDQGAPATQPEIDVAAKSCKKRKIKQAKGAAAEPAVALPDEMPPAAVDNLSQPADLATDAASLARKKKKQRNSKKPAPSAPDTETEQRPVETGDNGHASPVQPAGMVPNGPRLADSKKVKKLPRTEALPTPNAGTDQQHVGTDSIGNVSPSKPAGTTVEASTLLVMKKKKKKRKKGAPKIEAPPTPDAEAEKGGTEGIGNATELESKAVEAPAAIKTGSAAKAFQRVKAEEWTGKQGGWDNSYRATFGEGGWGAKAQAVLGQVRGKDFRHEKTKKKRGSYRGGVIDNNVNSIKFESDDE